MIVPRLSFNAPLLLEDSQSPPIHTHTDTQNGFVVVADLRETCGIIHNITLFTLEIFQISKLHNCVTHCELDSWVCENSRTFSS